MVVAIFTGVPCSTETASPIHHGFTHTAAKLKQAASSHRRTICSAVASDLSRVWSMKPAIACQFRIEICGSDRTCDIQIEFYHYFAMSSEKMQMSGRLRKRTA